MLCSTNFVSVFLVFLNKRGEAPYERNALTLTFIKCQPTCLLINIIKTTLPIQ